MPARAGPRGPLQRLVDAREFERVLRTRRRAATDHFAVHHCWPAVEASPPAAPDAEPAELSTTMWTTAERPVDDSFAKGSAGGPRLGAVVPKRHARRAVTRSLLKRQIYAAAERHRGDLSAGTWVVRLRAPFDRALFPSAASDALKITARDELERLFVAATGPAP
ncbi:MAG: ribonuclease P protein component [Caldimonas sp.]